MDENANTIFQAAMMLPENERVSLVSRLLDTMSPDDVATSIDDPALAEELDRRFADREGEVPWLELRAEG